MEGVGLGFLRITWTFFKHLDSVLCSCGPFDTEIYCRKMTLSQLLEDPVLLPETIGISCSGMAENKSRFIQDRDFITIF